MALSLKNKYSANLLSAPSPAADQTTLPLILQCPSPLRDANEPKSLSNCLGQEGFKQR